MNQLLLCSRRNALMCCLWGGLLGFLLVLMTGLVQAQEVDDSVYEDDYAVTDTYLTVAIQSTSRAYLNLYLYPKNSGLVETEPLVASLETSLGCPLTKVRQENDDFGWDVSGYCQPTLSSPSAQQWGQRQGQLHLEPLINSLNAQQFETLDVTFTPPDIGHTNVRAETQFADEFMGWIYGDAHVYTLTLADPEFTQISFSFGYDVADIYSRMGGLAVILLLPIPIIFWQRQRALAFEGEDKAPIWFGFQRNLSGLMLAMWVIWLVSFIAADVGTWLPLLLGTDALWIEGIEHLCFFLLPLGTLLACYGLSHRVFKQIGEWDYSGLELMAQVLVSQLAVLLPLLCFLFGFQALMEGEPQVTAVLIMVSIATSLILTPLQQKLRDMTPHSITTGELRDRIFSLATPAGVTLNQIYVLPMKRSRMLNAFAVRGGTVMLTDYLIQHLSKAEVDAVMAHEIAHLQYGHVRKRAWAMMIPLVVVIVCISVAIPRLLESVGFWSLLLPITVVGFSIAYFFSTSRRFEYQADAQAALLTGNPEAMITGLVKLARLNQMPLQWGRLSESWMTHPSMRRRIEALGQRYDIALDELNRLVQAASQDSDATDHYRVPTVVHDGTPIFSSQVKQRILQRLAWSIVLCFTLVPAIFARLMVELPTAGLRWLGYVVGLGIMLVLFWRVIDVVPLWGFQSLQKRFADRLQQKGIDVGTGLFVGFSPNDEPRYYEGFSNWDIGYLFIGREGMAYMGEQTQFVLTPQQVTAIFLGCRDASSWINTSDIYVSWRWGDRSGTFNLQPTQGQSLTQLKGKVSALKQRLEQWQAHPETEAPLPQSMVSIGGPSIERVTSNGMSHFATPARFFNNWLTLALLGLAACALLGVMATGLEANLYVVVCSTVGAIVQFIPMWRYTQSVPKR